MCLVDSWQSLDPTSYAFLPFEWMLCSWLTNLTCLYQVEGSSETTEKVKKSLSSFLGVISDTLAPPPDKTIDCDVITLVATPAGTTEVYDSSKVGNHTLNTDVPANTMQLHTHWLYHRKVKNVCMYPLLLILMVGKETRSIHLFYFRPWDHEHDPYFAHIQTV